MLFLATPLVFCPWDALGKDRDWYAGIIVLRQYLYPACGEMMIREPLCCGGVVVVGLSCLWRVSLFDGYHVPE